VTDVLARYPARGVSASQSGKADTLLRSTVFIIVLFGGWTSFAPFPRLDLPAEFTDAGSSFNQIAYSALFIILGIWCLANHPERLLWLIRPIMILALAWCALAVVTSWDPSLSARRFAYALITIGIAGMVVLLPRNLRHFADLMAAVALILTISSYLGVALSPAHAVHQASDTVEMELAGDWRGAFGHKNGASAAMVVFIFTGLLVSKVRSRYLGWFIIVLAAPFLWFTHSKTAISELPLVLIVSFLMANLRSPFIGMTIVVLILAVLETLTLGSIYVRPIHAFVESLGLDPTFTGRSDVWNFVIGHISEKPLTGFGFATFWGTEQVVYGMNENGWARYVSNAHNGYLDLALTTGIIGSALMSLWLIFCPILDFYRAERTPANDPLALFFLRICLFAAFESCFESSFLLVGSFLFIVIIMAFGMRYSSRTRVVA
jgi:O-antigen ligase